MCCRGLNHPYSSVGLVNVAVRFAAVVFGFRAWGLGLGAGLRVGFVSKIRQKRLNPVQHFPLKALRLEILDPNSTKYSPQLLNQDRGTK